METDSLARARQFLRFSPAARTFAVFFGGIASLLVFIDLFLLWMIVDLLVVRGRLPQFEDLSPKQQISFVEKYEQNKPTREILKEFMTMTPAPWPADDETKLQEWAKKENRFGDLRKAARADWDFRWLASLQDRLNKLGFEETAERLISKSADFAIDVDASLLQDAGVLSLAIRSESSLLAGVVRTFVKSAGWSHLASDTETANERALRGLLLLLTLLLALQFACLGGTYVAASRVCLEAIVRLRRSIYHQALRLAEYRSDDRRASEVAELAMDKVESVHDAFYIQLTSQIYMPVLFVVLVLSVILIEPRTSLIIVPLSFLGWFSAGQMLASAQHRVRRSTRKQENQAILLQESFSMIRLVKAYLMEGFNLARVERQLSDYSYWQERRSQLESIVWPVLTMLIGFWSVAFLFFAGRWVLAANLPLASIVVQLLAVFLLVLPIRSHFRSRSKLKKGNESSKILFDYLDKKSEIGQFIDADFLQPISKKIEFIGITARVGGNRKGASVRDINLTIPAKQRTAIVGLNEAQKHLLISLLPRFQDSSDGEIKLDGRNIRYYSHDSLRAQIGMVLQSDLIFNDTVASNIGCGDPSYTLPQIIEAAKLTHAHQFIQKLPYGYMTMIGELGHSLTTGEQFRIALARAVLRDPSVLVIEEPQEQWDEDTKTLVDDTTDRIAEGRTLIYLAHRISTLKKCDQVILIEHGNVIATGVHKDLLTTQDRYRHLYYVEFSEA
jgi:ATP-binding cassette, subfamily B, bacterial